MRAFLETRMTKDNAGAGTLRELALRIAAGHFEKNPFDESLLA